MNPVPEDCKYLWKSTSHYYHGPKHIERTKPTMPEEADPFLINGDFKNNLHINGLPRIYDYKDYKYAKNEHEDYIDFTKRNKVDLIAQNKCCANCKDIIDPNVHKPELVEDELSKLYTTEYHTVYSPDEYRSLNENVALKLYKIKIDPPPLIPTEQRLEYQNKNDKTFILNNGFAKRKIAGGKTENLRLKIQDDLKRLYRTGVTTYYVHICVPAIIRADNLRQKCALKDGPLDRYTNRRI